jgi:hypothetical protein
VRKRRGQWTALAVLLVAPCALSRADDLYDTLAKYATGSCITREGLVVYLLNESTLLKTVRDHKCPMGELRRLAEHRADGIIAMAWSNPRPSENAGARPACVHDALSLDDASALLEELSKSRVAARGCQTVSGPEAIDTEKPAASLWTKMWSNLTLKRDLTDAFDPRQTKITLPAIVSFLHDEEASAQRYQTTIVGSLAYQFLARDFGDGKRNTFTSALGLDADVEPTKAANSDVVNAGINMAVQWVSRNPMHASLESILVSATPKFTTDSSLNSRVYQMSLTALPTSKPLALGQVISLPLGLAVMFEPTGGVEYGRVRDADGNQKLAAIQAEGAYTRLLIQARARVWAPRWDQGLSLVGTYTLRYDTGEYWGRYFLDVLLLQDLDEKGTLSATLAYRRGRKPPDFAETNQVQFGIGVRK